MLIDAVNYMRIYVFQDQITMKEDFRQGLTEDLLLVSIAVLGKGFVQWLGSAVGGQSDFQVWREHLSCYAFRVVDD
jgi:hypothetical protein